jgi:general secretion pathway protein B
MSYILDALKKSEKERKKVSAPDLKTVHDTMPYRKKKYPVWPYLIAGVLLLNAVVFVLWFGPWATKKTDLNKQAVVAKKSEESVPGAAVSDKGAITTAKVEETPASKTVPDKMTTDNDMKAKSQPLQAQIERKKKDTDKIIQKSDLPVAQEIPQVQSETNSDNKIPVPIPHKIYNLNELPLSIQQLLPAFNISTFIYSDDPGLRTVKINGYTLKEGQNLNEGMKLEEIRPDGLIFNYQNFRVRIGIK